MPRLPSLFSGQVRARGLLGLVLMAVLGGALSVVGAEMLADQRTAMTEELVKAQLVEVRGRMRERLNDRALAVERMARRIEDKVPTVDEWQRDADRLREGLRLSALQWWGPRGELIGQSPGGGEAPPLLL